MAMFVGNLTPVLLITGACALDGGLQLQIIQNAMLMAGLITLLQIFTIGPVGAKLPIVMGTSSGFIGVCSGVASTMGQGIVTYGAIIFASFIGGLFETVLGFFLKPLRRFFPSLVTGTVVMAIGLSLISVGINSFGGGNNNGDFGSLPNLFVGTVVLVTIILLKHFTKGVTSTASILIGIVVGYIVCGIMGMILPTTYQYIDPNAQETVTKTCSWVLDFSKVSDASWFAVPAFMPFGFSKDMIDLRAIIPIVIMFIVTAVETVGDTSCYYRRRSCKRSNLYKHVLSGSVICDGLGSSIAAFFGVLPNTSFSQNVGLIAMTKIVNLFAISTGAIFLVLCGLFPKLAAIIQMMPQSVLGGAAVMMFASIVVSGIQLVTKDGVSNRTVTIVSVALGLGYGLGANTEVLSNLPQFVELIFGGSGIVPAAIIAMILNIAIPKDKEAA